MQNKWRKMNMVNGFIGFVLGMLAMAILRCLTSKDAESLIRNIEKSINRRADSVFGRVPHEAAKEVVDEIQDKIEAWTIRQEGV